jgi:hypothetical protein
MLDVRAFARSVQAAANRAWKDMAEENENADAAAQRLETALERIASLAGRSRPPEAAAPAPLAAEIAAQLDAIIERLRAALGDAP